MHHGLGGGAIALFIGTLASCAETSTDAAVASCERLCDHLIGACAYDAYPTVDSCMAGCADQVNADVDIEVLETCIVEAGCETFAIVECQNHHGAGAADAD